MKTYCLKDLITGRIFKIFLSEEDLEKYLKEHSEVTECIGCIECEDAPSITLE